MLVGHYTDGISMRIKLGKLFVKRIYANKIVPYLNFWQVTVVFDVYYKIKGKFVPQTCNVYINSFKYFKFILNAIPACRLPLLKIHVTILLFLIFFLL